MLKILVAGRSGQVAQSLVEAAQGIDNVDLMALGRPDLDIADPQSVERALADTKPQIVINAAAYTAVDQAETDRDEAFACNATGPRNLAVATAAGGIPLIHISTDYVFNGEAETPYREGHATDPLGVYGASKLAGEDAVRASNPQHLILRTAWVYGTYGNNFLKTMLRVAESRDALNVVADQRGAPTSSHDIAAALLTLAQSLDAKPEGFGTYHMAACGEGVWADFAEAIFDASASDNGPSAVVHRIPSSEYPTPAKRPGYSVLDSSALEQAFGVRLPEWQEPIAAIVSRVLQERD